MTKHIAKFAAVGTVSVGLLLASAVLAATPTISAYATGVGDSVQLNVNGDANSTVILNYNSSGIVRMSVIGSTNSSGAFSTTLSTATYGVTPNSLFAVTVNGQQSNSAVWPYSATTTATAGLSLSQASLTLSVGQSYTITATNNSGSSLYLSGNTNPAVANINLNGNQIVVTANTAGATTVSVCSLANSANCANLSITVPSANAQPITLSQSSPSVPYGQNVAVTIGGGTGVYSVVSNSNPAAVQATLNGSTVNLYGSGSSGSAAITVCSTDMSSCGVINATAVSTVNYSTLSFSQTNPSLAPGQVMAVTVSGSSGTYYAASNSNPNAVQANIVGNTITLIGQSTGVSTLNVCSTAGACGTISVNVAVPGTTSLTLNPASLSLSAGQTSNAIVAGSGGYYVASNSSPATASVTISGNTLTVTAGSAAGTTNVSVCQSGGQCATLYVTVTGTTSASGLALTQVISAGQGINLMLSGGTAPYTATAASSIVTAQITSNSFLTLIGVSAGTTSVNVCASAGGCVTVPVIVTAAAAAGTPAASSASSGYVFTTFMTKGDQGAGVLALQKELAALGYLTATPTGYFGPATFAAVKAFQKANGIASVGYVGPATRTALNSH